MKSIKREFCETFLSRSIRLAHIKSAIVYLFQYKRICLWIPLHSNGKFLRNSSLLISGIRTGAFSAREMIRLLFLQLCRSSKSSRVFAKTIFDPVERVTETRRQTDGANYYVIETRAYIDELISRKIIGNCLALLAKFFQRNLQYSV